MRSEMELRGGLGSLGLGGGREGLGGLKQAWTRVLC